jgi:putative PIG3 family NAD(P)H quinone oxidoreductase
MTQARAVRITAPGGPDKLVLDQIDVREPGPTEVLVEIAAAGVNRADCLQRKGVYPPPPGVIADVPGLELAGYVAKVGSEVRTRKIGDKVMAICSGGALATHIVLHERELIPVPVGIDLVHAAAIPEVFMTAYDALFLQASVGLGSFALIHAIGSGIGTAALQLVHAAGGSAIGTSRKADKLERVKALGLEHGIVTGDAKFAERVGEITGGRYADAILDTVGASYLGENIKSLATGGTIVTIGLLGGAKGELPLGLLVGKRASLRGSVLRARPLEEKIALAASFTKAVLPLFAHGKLRPIVEDVMPMAEVQAAHARMESDALFGKLVLTW